MIKKAILLTTAILMINTALAYASNVVIESEKQSYDGKNNTTTFEGKVKVDFDNITVKSPKAYLKANKEGKPGEAVFVQGAQATKKDADAQSDIKANIIRVSILENKVKAEGNAVLTMQEPQKPAVTIKANSQEFDIENNTVTAVGNVIINYDDISTNSKTARIDIDKSGKPSMVNLVGAAKLTRGKSVINAASFTFNPVTNELIASGNAYSQTILDDATQVAIWADYQQYDKANSTLITTGKVKIHYKDYIATGPKASFIPEENGTKPNKIVFMGRSSIKEGDRVVEADKIEITMNPKNFTAVGNVKSKFTQVQDPDKKKNNKPDSNTLKAHKNQGIIEKQQTYQLPDINFDKNSNNTDTNLEKKPDNS